MVMESKNLDNRSKVGRLLLSWDANEFETEDEARDAWDYLTEQLTEIMDKKNEKWYWKAIVRNFGWQGRNGYKYLMAYKGDELLGKILPRTECNFRIYNYGKGIAINNFHHDSPTGKEWYYITPCAESTYNRYC
jgi:hypothetical protein